MVILSVIQLLLVGLGLAYFTATMAAGLRFLHKRPRTAAPSRIGRGMTWLSRYVPASVRLPSRAITTTGPTPEVVYYLVPCLNEAEVIGGTVGRLVVDSRVRVVVVDDACRDDTVELARRAADAVGCQERLRVVHRLVPFAGQGKGPALNAGFAEILTDVRDRGLDPDAVVVCVMDADGHLSEGALDHVLPLFADAKVGGVQLAVGIRNRSTWLTRLQHIEFWALSAVSQFGRVATGTVSLGGNGQFTRLSALQGIGREPWAARLTEDLELAVELNIAGWRLTTTSDAYVDQQALTSLRRLVDQRTRWFQGHMSAIRHAPRIWRARKMSHWAAMELMLYLLVPWTLVLPWSIVFHLSLLSMLAKMDAYGALAVGSSGLVRAESLVLWYLFSFAPNLAAAYLYRRRQRDASWWQALVLGHLLLPANYIAYLACWRALGRMVRGESGWVKTQHSAEDVPAPAAVRLARTEELV